ncbi:unnamed protein product, partial [Ectocarpus sp. 12 AP-2014]
ETPPGGVCVINPFKTPAGVEEGPLFPSPSSCCWCSLSLVGDAPSPALARTKRALASDAAKPVGSPTDESPLAECPADAGLPLCAAFSTASVCSSYVGGNPPRGDATGVCWDKRQGLEDKPDEEGTTVRSPPPLEVGTSADIGDVSMLVWPSSRGGFSALPLSLLPGNSGVIGDCGTWKLPP